MPQMGATFTANSHRANKPGPRSQGYRILPIDRAIESGRPGSYVKADLPPLESSYLFNSSNAWEVARSRLNRHSTIRKGIGKQKLGLGYSFARAMREQSETVAIGLVVNAKGGSNIELWGKGTEFYYEALRRTKLAQKYATLKGLLWHQGESNSAKPEGYLEKLTDLIMNLKADLGEPAWPFIAGQINNVSAINDQLTELTSKVPNTGVVSSEGLNAMDRWHFDAKSMNVLGERYAEELVRLQ